jgi:HEAT repeat protein
MVLIRTSKPNVSGLARRGDSDALVAAAGYQDLISARGDAMVDRGARVRTEAILALGRLGPECGTEAVYAALGDPADEVRMAAIRVLFERKDAAPLAAALAAPPPPGHDQSRARAITALRELRRPECAPALAAALVHAPGDAPVGDDEAALLKLLLATEEGSETATEVVEYLLAALVRGQDAVADRAADLLAIIEPLSTEGLISELEGGAAPHRAAAVLARVRDMRALEPLLEGLAYGDARVRAECAGALGELRDPAAVDGLIHASRDADHRVRSQASCALEQLGMVAIMVGVSSMLRPMILEAMAGPEAWPALIETVNAPIEMNGSSGDNDVDVDADDDIDEPPPDPTSRETLRACWPDWKT